MDNMLLLLLLLLPLLASSESLLSRYVRLMNGTTLCSGRLEVYNPRKGTWFSLCEADFNQQDAKVVCRELGCGRPLVLKGVLYGEVEAPLWTEEFHCKGDESDIQSCESSGSILKTCSPGRVVGLTCSDPLGLMGGTSRCRGALELKHLGEWRPVYGPEWTRREAAVVCEYLDCGSVISVQLRKLSSRRPVWWIDPGCVQFGFSLKNYYVKLVNGTTLCSGRVEVKSNSFNQYHRQWSSVCEADFDQQDAKVVCRELGCGSPSVLMGMLYREVEAPIWMEKFNCGGYESALMDCKSSSSDINTCSPRRAVGLTCSGKPIKDEGSLV
ncbi:scavenger receptor cysteine-rich type 1 protein M130-like [Cololabis saira]|uniref:scavenger receptor cysteine-rich type 1 protein M130-like n=1 Tax=Cololabis saira TaxID=129043 RepID=UPI002AD21F66|nr:scavenger receptor cysteine-rich type 1 protein M130-like [Cololabis saira]